MPIETIIVQYIIVFGVYLSYSATMHTRIETTKLPLPVILPVIYIILWEGKSREQSGKGALIKQ